MHCRESPSRPYRHLREMSRPRSSKKQRFELGMDFTSLWIKNITSSTNSMVQGEVTLLQSGLSFNLVSLRNDTNPTRLYPSSDVPIPSYLRVFSKSPLRGYDYRHVWNTTNSGRFLLWAVFTHCPPAFMLYSLYSWLHALAY